MIGAATALYEATNNQDYLEKAKTIVSFVLSSETVTTSYGPVLDDGASCSGDCDEFKGPTFRYLSYYNSVVGDNQVRACEFRNNRERLQTC
jgi:predicted alpha-1,6-mannanase (GH76 family)